MPKDTSVQNSQTNAPASQAHVYVEHPYLSLMGLFLGGFTGMYSETALNIALPQLSAAFNVELALTQWLVIGYMLVIGLVLPFASMLLKWFAARKLTLFALGSFFVGAVICIVSPTFEVALVGRLIQGIGTGLILPTTFALITEVVPPNKLGTAMGISSLVVMFAPAIGPTLSGLLIGAFSWRAIFVSFALMLAVSLVFVLKFQVSPYELTRPHIDALSVVLSCLGFGGIVLGVGIASSFGWISVPTLSALIVGFVSLAIYAYRQVHMEVPVLDLRVFKIQGFRIGVYGLILNFGAMMCATYVLPQFYQNGMLLSVTVAGLLMLPGGIVNSFVSMLSGKLYDRVGARPPAIVGFAITACAAALLMTVSSSTPVAQVVAYHILLLIGIPLAMAPCQSHALANLPHELSTDGSTVLNTLQQVMGAVCTAVATSLLAMGQASYYSGGGSDAALAFTNGAHWGFALTFILVVVGFVVAWRMKPVKAEPVAEGMGHPAGARKPTEPRVTALMKTDVFAIPASATAFEALELFSEKHISGAPVLDEQGKLQGFVSDGDILGMLARQIPTYTSFFAIAIDSNTAEFKQQLSLLKSTPVAQLCTKDVVSVSVDDDMRDICSLLTSQHLKKVPVMDGDVMVGVINRSDITHYTVDLYRQMNV